MTPPAAAAPPLRVVLVEDDPMVRQLLQMVWEDYELTLVTCTQVPEAVQALRQAPAGLIVTDLMLPGESGLDLLARLAAEPALRGTARVAVFSAGLSPAMLSRLRQFDVWRVLHKPLPIDALVSCVQEAGARLRAAPAQAAAGTPGQAAPGEGAEDPGQARAVAEHFGGNRPLFDAFRSAALQQFTHDIAAGEGAVQQADAPALRRLAHSLKSVLRSIGHVPFAQLAAALETSAEHADWPVARSQWSALRGALAELAWTPDSQTLHTADAPGQQSVTPPASGPRTGA